MIIDVSKLLTTIIDWDVTGIRGIIERVIVYDFKIPPPSPSWSKTPRVLHAGSRRWMW
jgi:hypothetical protein